VLKWQPARLPVGVPGLAHSGLPEQRRGVPRGPRAVRSLSSGEGTGSWRSSGRSGEAAGRRPASRGKTGVPPSEALDTRRPPNRARRLRKLSLSDPRHALFWPQTVIAIATVASTPTARTDLRSARPPCSCRNPSAAARNTSAGSSYPRLVQASHGTRQLPGVRGGTYRVPIVPVPADDRNLKSCRTMVTVVSIPRSSFPWFAPLTIPFCIESRMT
jgi:hypothetical protein